MPNISNASTFGPAVPGPSGLQQINASLMNTAAVRQQVFENSQCLPPSVRNESVTAVNGLSSGANLGIPSQYAVNQPLEDWTHHYNLNHGLIMDPPVTTYYDPGPLRSENYLAGNQQNYFNHTLEGRQPLAQGFQPVYDQSNQPSNNIHPLAGQPLNATAPVDWNGFRDLLLTIPRTHPCPEFWGKDHESPTAFLRNMEHYFITTRIPDAHRTTTAAAAMKGNASSWWSDYRGLDFTWDQFRILLSRP